MPFGFIGLFTIGGLTGLFLATLAVDVHVHDTYFVIAHFHYIMVGGAVMGYLGGLHFWWPKITGRMYPEGWGKFSRADHFSRLQPDLFPSVHAGLSRHAAPLSFLPGRIPGLARHVVGRRVDPGVGYVIPLVYFSGRYATAHSPAPTRGAQRVWNGKRLPHHPRTTSRRRPTVTEEAYAYGSQEVHVG